jgi:exosome complex component RRP4
LIIASVLGKVNTISKLVTVIPSKFPYVPEVGDVIIGRIISVEKKLWRVNLNAQREGILNLTAINLPQGEQRIRNEEDQMSMRIYFKENDLLSGEIQQITQNGNIHIQTRNLKYGKLKNGILVKVNHSLIKKKKHQFIEIVYNIKIILALNGYCWIYYSTVKIEDEYFSDDKNKIDIINKEEKIDEKSCILIILIRNIIKNIDEAEIEIKKETIIRYYELFIEMYRKNVNFDDKDSMKKLQKIDEKENINIINLIKTEIKNNKIKEETINNNNKEKNKMDLE